jgi:hypothetical protein
MKKLLFLLPLIFSLSCFQDDEKKVDCLSCEHFEDVRWYVNLSRDFTQDCHVTEDFRFNKNGTVDVWRFGKDENGDPIDRHLKSVCKFTRTECTIELFDLSTDYLADFANCDGYTMNSIVSWYFTGGGTIEVVDNSCDYMYINYFLYSDREP